MSRIRKVTTKGLLLVGGKMSKINLDTQPSYVVVIDKVIISHGMF